MIMQCDAMSTAMEEESGFELQHYMGFCLGWAAPEIHLSWILR